MTEIIELSSEQMTDVSPEVTSPKTGMSNGVVDSFNKRSLLNKMNSPLMSTISSSSEKLSSASSSTTQQVMKSSSSSRFSNKSQVLHSVSSQQQQQENRNFSRSVSVTSSNSASSESRLKMYSGQRNLSLDCTLSEENDAPEKESSPQEIRFEQKSVSTSAAMKVTADGMTTEKVAASNKELKRVQADDISYEEKQSTAAVKARVEADGFTAEKRAAIRQDQKQLKTGDTIQQQQITAKATSMKLDTDDFSAEKVRMSKQEERQMLSQGIFRQEKSHSSASSAKVTINTSKASLCNQNLLQMGSPLISSPIIQSPTFEPLCCLPSSQKLAITEGVEEDLELLHSPSNQSDVEKAMSRFASRMSSCAELLKNATTLEAIEVLATMNELIRKAWAVPTYGHDLGFTMCNILRIQGALDVILLNLSTDNDELQFATAQVLEQCLSTENRAYVVENGLEQVIRVACACSNENSAVHNRVGTGILCHLFKHSESTCSDLIRMGGLKSILYDCRSCDVETLRNCATALANLSLYGGPDNHQAMIKHKAPVWLFPLAFNNDDNIKYYACLAITALVANKEIEAAVIKSGTLNLVEPFVTTHNPAEFAKSSVAHAHGQSKDWLLRFVPVLDSKREEARSLAAFHFAMEAGIKKKQGNTSLFAEIGALEALRRVASSPNAIASKYAAQALQLIGEEVPHKLTQQVPLWTVEDVKEWVKQIGFTHYTQEFVMSRVDGDLLLQLDECSLKDDIGIKNGILRKRFLRELSQLKRMADYSSVDTTNVNQILQNLGPEFCQYTYRMLQRGVDKDSLRMLSDDQMLKDCGIDNSIHRLRIARAIREMNQSVNEIEDEIERNKSLDVFISYRRSNGSQLASLLKVHLQLRSFSVFIDVERLEAGKFDNNLLNSIRQAKHFILVLTPNALDRCIGDTDCKDWVHKEIVEALQSQCNIIPILDCNFQWPEPEMLPEDMRAVSYFNGVRWIHDYQDACVDKLERFMRGEMNVRSDGPLGRYIGMGGPGTPGTPSTSGRTALYHRSASNDSAKGSVCSDKDSNGNGRVADQPQASDGRGHCG